MHNYYPAHQYFVDATVAYKGTSCTISTHLLYRRSYTYLYDTSTDCPASVITMADGGAARAFQYDSVIRVYGQRDLKPSFSTHDSVGLTAKTFNWRPDYVYTEIDLPHTSSSTHGLEFHIHQKVDSLAVAFNRNIVGERVYDNTIAICKTLVYNGKGAGPYEASPRNKNYNPLAWNNDYFKLLFLLTQSGQLCDIEVRKLPR